MRGPQLPGAGQEGRIGSPMQPRGGMAPTTPGGFDALPPPEGQPADGQQQSQPGAETPSGTQPDALPDLDPFGAAPPSPPAWLAESIGRTPPPAWPAQAIPLSQPLSPVDPPQDDVVLPEFDGPNLHGDDAPPALPRALHRSAATAQAGRAQVASAKSTQAQVASLPVSLVQPASVLPLGKPEVDSRVVPASATMPAGITLINPAAAIAVQPGDDGLQQAIYYEASDDEAVSAAASDLDADVAEASDVARSAEASDSETSGVEVSDAEIE